MSEEISRYRYSFSELPETWNGSSDITKFFALFTSKWDQLHDKTDTFRYKIGNIQQRMIEGKYLLLLNPDRGFNKRPPDSIKSVNEAVDPKKFNFTKVSQNEIIMELQNGSNIHKILVNVSPISRYHSLLCPFLDECLPQIANKINIQVVLEVLFLAQNRDLRVGFNSLCGWASVNHLHYHLFMESTSLPLENMKCTKIIGPLYRLDTNYPVPGFCFEIKNKRDVEDRSLHIGFVLEYFLNRDIAHNMLVTRGCSMDGDDEVVRLYLWPRLSAYGVKNFSEDSLNSGFAELSGWCTIYKQEHFDNINAEYLDEELYKWKYDDASFQKMCDDVQSLFK